jgi:hypothetical protein
MPGTYVDMYLYGRGIGIASLYNFDFELCRFLFFCASFLILLYEKFEDTKGAIRIRISKKNRQYNGQQKKYKRTNNDKKSIHIKLKIEYN